MPANARKEAFLLGTGIGRSLSPAIHNAAFSKLGINATYSLLDLSEDEFDPEVRKLARRDDVIGFNVTTPFKEKIIPHLTKLDQLSRTIGAVNTVTVSRRGKLSGFNTDYDGIISTFDLLDIRRSGKAVVLGAGGAARACVYALSKRGFRSVVVLNRTEANARAIDAHFRGKLPGCKIETGPLTEQGIKSNLPDCRILINAVSGSSRTHFPVRLDFSGAEKGMRIFDLNYRGETLFLKTAKRQRVQALGGLNMLVVQAARSFEIWTGEKAPIKTMMAAARKALTLK